MDSVQQELDYVPQSTLIPATHLAAFSCTSFCQPCQDKVSLRCGSGLADAPALLCSDRHQNHLKPQETGRKRAFVVMVGSLGEDRACSQAGCAIACE